MSNMLSVRRVMIQTIDEKGQPEGEPTYGVLAADGYEQAYNDIYDSLESLNQAIGERGILGIVQDIGAFAEFDPNFIGTDNYYGTGKPDEDD